MLKEKADETALGLQSGNAGNVGSRDITKLIFDIANFDFYLKNMDASVKKTKNLLMKYSGASGCTIMFLDSYDYLWKIGEKTTYPFKLGEGVAGWAAKHQKRVFIEDIKKDKRFKIISKKSSGAILSFPIIKNDEVLGVINLTYSGQNKSSFPPQKAVIDVFAKKMESVLENIILLHEAEGQRVELQARKDLPNILEDDLPLGRKLKEIKKEMIKFVDVDNISICVTDSIRAIPLYKCTDSKNVRLIASLTKVYADAHGRKRTFFDLSEKQNFELITRKGTGHTTIYPISTGNQMNGFILIEDSVKNIENLSVLEKNLIILAASKISKFIIRQQSSKKIIEEKERWRTVFHNVDDGIILLSRDKLIIEANLKARELLGSKKTSLSGKNIFSLLKIMDPEVESPTLSSIKNLSRFKATDQQALSKKIDNFFSSHRTIRPKEYYIKTKNGRYWVMISMKTAMQDLESEIYGIIHIKDITKGKEVEQDKNEFMSMVSHELRTPLTAMKGYLTMTLNSDYGKLNEKQERSLTRVEESTDRMVVLVEDILDVSRIELGKFNLHKEPLNLSEAVCMMIRELGAKIKTKKIAVTVQNKNIECCLKKSKSSTEHQCKNLNIYILADRARFMQILGNLIDNAVKYSFDGGKVEINITSGKEFAEVSIKDNGVGVAKEDQDKLFRRFSRIHNPLSIQAGGTGLGLYITKKLVVAHGGEIGVSGKQGEGTTFSVKMPIAKQLPLI
ncbi:MAG: ATP-binding protein [bacterium]|nr:ATP-binding protein [bacterium]